MAREDLIIRLLGDLNLRARPAPASKNTALDKFTLPTETVGLTETATATRKDPATFKWWGAPDPAFVRNSPAYKQDGSQVGSSIPRYEAGKFNNGVHIGEAVTNLFTANQSSVETDTTGFLNGASAKLNAGSTITRVTTDHWSGTACLKVDTTAASDMQGVTALAAAGTAGVAHYGLAYVKGTAGQSIQAVMWDGGPIYDVKTVTFDGTWQKVEFNIVAGAATDLTLGFRTPSAVAITFYIDGLMIRTGTATSWHIGGETRQADSLYYTPAAALPNEWFISGFWKPDQASTISRANNLVLMETYFDANNNFQIFYNPTDDKLYLRKVHAGTVVDVISVALTFAAGDIIAFGIAQLTQAYGDLAAGMHLWYRIASGAVVHVSNMDVNLPTVLTKAYVGCFSSAGYECNGVIDALKLVDLAAELALGTTVNNAWAEAFLTAAGAPTADAATLLLANFDDSLVAGVAPPKWTWGAGQWK